LNAAVAVTLGMGTFLADVFTCVFVVFRVKLCSLETACVCNIAELLDASCLESLGIRLTLAKC